MIRLFAMDVSKISDAMLLRLPETLSAERRAKALAAPNPEKQRLSLGAGLCLAAALREAGLAEQELSYVHGENGKPRIIGADLCFSVSHSHSMALAALSCREVGADIELIRDFPVKLPFRHFSEAEQAYLASLDEEGRKLAFFRLWTIRESFLKAMGIGLTVPLSSFSVETEPKPRVIQTLSDLPWQVTEKRLGDYAIAITHLEKEVGDITMITPKEV